MKDLFLFVRPPRPLWPMNSPASAFWPPLAFASLAAMLREQVRDLGVEILDAPILEMGWRTLASELARRRPTYVGMGEEAVSCTEGLRLAALAKAVGARVIAGGCFFGHVAPEVLRTGLVDVVVHGEGERTIVELVEALRSGGSGSLRQVAGISFRNGDEIVQTALRPLIEDLDRLPMPAYDLLPVERYGRRSRNHPRFAAIELGRGCVSSCNYCVLWRQMGKMADGRLTPHLRVKSPERLREEVHRLVRQHGRGYLGWVDPTFNAHPDVPGQLAERLLRDGLRIGQSAWMRADALRRDAASGALAACVEAGLNEIYLGLERPDDASLARLGKRTTVADARAALEILREHFPQVLTIGSFIYGLPEDTPADIRAMHRLAFELQLDQFFFIPHTPLPGTPGWHSALWDATGRAFRDFNFLPTGRRHSELAALERALLWSVLFHWPAARWRVYGRRLFQGDARKRRVSWRLVARGAKLHAKCLWRRLWGEDDQSLMIFPSWYER